MSAIDIANLWKYDLRKGNTNHPRNGACLFDAGMWLIYGKIGDDPPCSCPVIRRYAIGLNDHMPDIRRQQLKPFILRVVGNRDHEASRARVRYLVLETVRRVVPLAFDWKWPKLAAGMRAISDDVKYAQIQILMREAKAAARADAAARAAAAYTDDAARADYAHGAAAAAIYAYSAAAAAADAARATATYAYSYADAWDKSIEILDGVLRIGKQSSEFNEAEIRTAVEAFDVARLVGASAS